MSSLMQPKNPDLTLDQYIDHLVAYAKKHQASDLHFEPGEKGYLIRYRIDGLLQKVDVIEKNLGHRLVAKFKVMAQINIAETRRPQDGRMHIKHQGHQLDFRLSTLPTVMGEKLVIRVLCKQNQSFGLGSLGFNPTQLALFKSCLARPQGLILITGPTGSGKTQSLYAALSHLNQEHLNLTSVEDPVEIFLEGMTQVQVNHAIDLDFSQALRSILRQDPDVIMIGEIRDLETAEIAIKAAQTGHLVLASLHTKSADQAIQRLLSLGISLAEMNHSMELVTAQRLLRKLCEQCKQPEPKAGDYLKKLGINDVHIQKSVQLFRAHGCEACNHGYRGRFAVFECIQNLSNLCTESHQVAKKRQLTLLDAALEKLTQGLTSIQEIQRVLSLDIPS
jgi:type IV pilus assembly protein PilB